MDFGATEHIRMKHQVERRIKDVRESRGSAVNNISSALRVNRPESEHSKDGGTWGVEGLAPVPLLLMHQLST